MTGANKSIGFEVARQLTQEGIYMYLGSRDLTNGLEAVGKLKAEGLNNVEVTQIDVTDGRSVIEARKEIGKRANVLDILINNAVTYGGYQQTTLESTIYRFKETYDANVYGPVQVIQAFIDY